MALAASGLAVAFSAGALMRQTRAATDARSLSFVGKLSRDGQPVTEAQAISFRFKKNGVEACAPPSIPAAPDASGTFHIAIPLAACPQSLFDGSAVVFDLLVGGEVAIADQGIGFVPQANYAEHLGYADCPLRYERDASQTAFVVCKRGNDTLVRVGKDATAFWIDRYEASVWENSDGTGKMYANANVDYPVPDNGQLGVNENAFAISMPNVSPIANITWLQADVACRASGKRLPTSEEWGIAARGTVDPGESEGAGGACRTMGLPVLTGLGSMCRSIWGAEDMIGNVAEWVSEWQAAPALSDSGFGETFLNAWGDGPTRDGTTNISSTAALPSAVGWHLPAGLLRGGYSGQGEAAGVLNLNLSVAPIHRWMAAGFRCVIPR